MLDLTSPRAEPLVGLRSQLFLHTVHAPDGRHPHGGIVAVRELLKRDHLGVVYSLPRRDRAKVATACVEQTRLRAPHADILLDAALYTGKRRKLGSDGLDHGWVRRQHYDRLRYALTDSGYIPANDVGSLERVLYDAEAIHATLPRRHGLIAALPIAVDWLTRDADQLRDTVNSYQVPVALMIEHATDPLAVVGAVEGLAHVLRATVPVGILRCDVSILGALAHGASIVSVGDSSSLRHFVPTKGGGGGHIPGTSILVPELLGFYRLDKLEDAMRATPGHPAWKCTCRVCDGRDLSWITASPEPHQAAFAHGVSAISAMARSMFIDRGDSAARHDAWQHAVQTADQTHRVVADETANGWKPPVTLKRWLNLAS